MRYQTFGRRTGLRVSQVALGTATFGPAGAGPDGSREIFEAFAAAGGTTIDTSDRYQGGASETVLGELLAGRRDQFVLITKYSAGGAPAGTGNSRKVMVRSLEASLTRLRTDYVDVYLPHFPDGVTPLEEILAGFDDLVRAGKILHGGLSNFPAWRVAGAATLADLRGLAPLVGLQTEYSLAERTAERELLPMAQAHGLGMLLYSPLAGGLLTGKYRRGEQGRLSGRGPELERTGQQTAVVDTVLAVAAETGSDPAQVALAWLLHRAALARTALVPILGSRTLSQLAGQLGALDLTLSEKHHQLMDDVSRPVLGSPHDTVVAALANGLDGDRAQLDEPPVPVG